MRSKKFLHILGVAGVIAHAVPLSHAAPGKLDSIDPVETSQWEKILLQDPTGPDAAGAFDQLASRFKGPGDKGRPDVFGPPGKPQIGPPGHYQG